MLDAIRWDADLIRRYDQAAPRYASYPSVVRFDGGIGSFDLLHALRDSRRAGRPLSLYLHLPFCANACYYCNRNKVITKDRGRAQVYLDSLEHEMALLAKHIGTGQYVEQLRLGGGTPTFLSHQELRRLMASLRKHFNLLDDDSGDYGIDIDPREADWPTIGLLRELGFNRINLSAQPLSAEVQQAINRLQTAEQTRAIIEAARTLQYRSVNIVLHYGLPRQNLANFSQTLDSIVELQPDSLSISRYRHQPEYYVSQRRIKAEELPDASEQLAMFQHGIERLTEAGYRYIGIDHFALPDDDLAIAQEDGTLQRNLLGYTTHGHCDLLGLGVSAISQIGELYCQNHTDLARYQQSLQQDQLATQRGLHCNKDDLIRRSIIHSLICDFELDIAQIETRFSIDFEEYFLDIRPQLAQMEADGLIALSPERLLIMPPGRLLARAVCMLFDHYQASQLEPKHWYQPA
ncbi:oxygen-independent coproporphyrinogen III oxidase [Stutzerimonas kirkiae]|uniref:Coproporphyrinogen-III oxidase n=1 Tax=Stutzerimonas kirkiae TaxID=2211392 RepID=A0A4Q9R2I9_9GAMM|nr:oxygen-independent coproporphyrinogen III oxidase [Stutzerimonas kirkiae]TBU93513.1 oxygen-independent coproporphyrinogen III oxidase [Stutzerimonas kirkiae]TBV01719.1 oxygen-independent coproporphyrinogen III oxidase [Stutzerimonas kirkiae]